MSTEELLEQLSTPTEFKIPPAQEMADKFSQSEPEYETIENGAESSGQPPYDDYTVTEDAPAFNEADFASIPPPPEGAKDKGFWKKQAAFWIGAVNMLQKKFLPVVYKKTILEEKDTVLLKDWREKKKRNPSYSIEDAITEDDELFHALDRYERLSEACDSIAFTQEEIDSITEPLAAVLEKHQTGTTTPEAQLAIAVALVMLPRLIPFFPGLSNFTIPTK
jgi:hypothetical protein